MSLSGAIIYEQPLNEHIRFCLRLESLFFKVKHYLNDNSSFGSRIALETILEILLLVDRPDLKTKLSKALSTYAHPLRQLLQKKTPLPSDVDEKKLHRILEQLDSLNDSLHTNLSKIGQPLRENIFLTTIQQRATTAGGTCLFNIPAYHLWLLEPAKTRLQNLANWLEHFSELKEIVTLILKLTRESVILESAKAENGFYQINLDPKISYQMVRLAVAVNEHVYPEISVGRHRLSVHFYTLNIEDRPLQAKKSLAFELACCRV